ncbi:MAG: UDP-N-acetylmuramoyl-L-alanyl-D-glutamate--2,6-diaminopimelate ligase [Candidatus Pacebacteria bacterium]|nr:UDP-N-acetylmuramoyl-L-alanyl-D-glutamate--2,6-diaminopimelate ligase [Candidatus Paceibacterota bacterium]
MLKSLIKKILPSFLLDWYHFLLAFLGAFLYRFPSKKLKVIGVTGTNGKSTVVEFITKIFEEAGIKVASQSSIRFKIGDKEIQNTYKMTMPGRFFIQKFLRQAVNSGCKYAIIEVTSEGIKQYRHKFIDFDTAVFTNLTPEHIEAHKGFENYKAAKGKLFQATKNVHIINLDDKNSDYFLNFSAKKTITYGLEKGVINNKNLSLKLLLTGNFNIYNALAAICVGLEHGVNLEICKKAVESIESIPGRMEIVISEPFKVFVDYAFTPNALEKVYRTVANLHESATNNTNISDIGGKLVKISAPNKLICVLGACGGGRDKWKRPVLGSLAAKYCDEVIITNEDPYDENPEDIINQVAKGAEDFSVDQRRYQRKSASIHKILDRREAIRKSLQEAKPGDAVVITGKGCEPWLVEAHGKKIPWDDRKIVQEEFEKFGIGN